MKSYGDKSFSVAAPELWNSLPEGVRSLDSLTHFKSAIKTYFLTYITSLELQFNFIIRCFKK